MHSPIPHNLDDKRSNSPTTTSSPSSKRSAFRPISKMVSKVNHDFLNRDPFAESSSSGSGSGSAVQKERTMDRGIHVMTPAKGKLGNFFGGGGGGGNAATPTASSSRLRRPSTSTSDLSSTGSTHINPYDDVPPVPKIRAGMTPEARTRHMPAPRPIPRHVLGSASNNQNQNQMMGGGERPTTMRLVRTVTCDDEAGEILDEGLPMLDSLGRTHRAEVERQQDEVDEVEGLRAGLEDMGLDAWNASRGQDETVLVTIRQVSTPRVVDRSGPDQETELTISRLCS